MEKQPGQAVSEIFISDFFLVSFWGWSVEGSVGGGPLTRGQCFREYYVKWPLHVISVTDNSI